MLLHLLETPFIRSPHPFRTVALQRDPPTRTPNSAYLAGAVAVFLLRRIPPASSKGATAETLVQLRA